jgi:hypothetical protein
VARIRVHSADGWAELQHPRLVGDSLAFERGVRIDRRNGRRSEVEGPLALTTFDRIDVRQGQITLVFGLGGTAVGALIGTAVPRWRPAYRRDGT